MADPGQITGWLNGLRAGDGAAAQGLWEEYFKRLVGLARGRLAGRPAGPAGSEDVALSAFASFCRGAEGGRFPRLNDRNDLWLVLIMLTARKAIDAIHRENAAKRGGRVKRGNDEQLEAVVGAEPTPSFAAEVAEECRVLLEKLGDDELKQIALAKLEGFSNAEIAERIGKSLATVERKLKLIRKTWDPAANT
ncbi:MAG: ECF-type sigma factor [Gemmataceae bacterium]